MHSLRQDGWRLVREGTTTPSEVVFATKDEMDINLHKMKGSTGTSAAGGMANGTPVELPVAAGV